MSRMSTKEVWAKFPVFRDFGKDDWFRYYRAINDEVPVDKISEDPYFLKLTDEEKICYENAVDELVEERKKSPWAGYDIESRYFDD